VSATRLAAAAIALTVVVAALVFLLGDDRLAPSPTTIPITPSSLASPLASARVVTPDPVVTPAPTPVPTTTASCTREAAPLPSALADDPCPGAILAVELAVAPVRLPIQRIVIEPGPFYCDVLWPGVGSPSLCYGVMVRPGQFMHAWASFVGSEKVAAVALGLDLPDDLAAPGATRPPWNATLAAIEVPPAGWVMP
jgi:hypothetical protein